MDNPAEEKSETLLSGSIDKSTRSLQLLIDAQRDFKQFLVLADRCEKPEAMGKMENNVEELKKLINELEVSVFKDAPKLNVEKRQNKGRKVDSGIASKDSAVLSGVEEDTLLNEIQGDQETTPKYAATSASNTQALSQLRLDELKSSGLDDSNPDTFYEFSRSYKSEENFLNTRAAMSLQRQNGRQKSNRTDAGAILTEELNIPTRESDA